MKYVFFGTPRFAAVILERLVNAGFTPVALICNPDRPLGRKQIITPPPTKEIVVDRHKEVEIFQPETNKELLEIGERLSQQVDFAVLAAYAKILPKELIGSFRLGIIGVHPSLLPQYRGATPIQSVILAGEDKTGGTLFLMDEKVDHGPVIGKRELEISKEDNYEMLEEKLAEMAGDLLIETLPKFVKHETQLTPQDEKKATYTSKFSTEDGYIEPEILQAAISGDVRRAKLVHRKIKALNPEPGVYTFLEGKRTKILSAEIKNGRLMLGRIQYAGGKPINV